MVSKLDVFLTISLFEGLSCNDIVKKMGKKQTGYSSIFKLIQKLKVQNLIQEKDNKYFVKNQEMAKKLASIILFCFQNNIDYNKIVSEKTAQFIKLGLEKTEIFETSFDPKTVQKISKILSKHGFIIIEKRKPFLFKIVYSNFLEQLAEFFFGKIKVKSSDLTENLNEIKVNEQLAKQFSEYKKASKSIISFDEIGFIHSSLSLEGNTLSLSETEKLIKKNIAPATKPFKDAQQVVDYKKALDEFIFPEKPLNMQTILEFHQIAMNSLKAGAGKIRKHNVQIKGNPNFKTSDWKQVPSQLQDFFGKIQEFEKQKKLSPMQIVENAALFHVEFQSIHPFVDGNSRTSRAIFGKILIEKGFPLIKIPVGFSDQYMKLTKLSTARNDKKFVLLMKQITIENLKISKQKLEYRE
ncbi:MAG: Fic family protein [archaeon]|nr:Fic family protein [archaeon]